MMSQVVKATLDEAHSDLPVGEPTNERTQQLLCLVDETLRQMDLNPNRQNSITALVQAGNVGCCSFSGSLK